LGSLKLDHLLFLLQNSNQLLVGVVLVTVELLKGLLLCMWLRRWCGSLLSRELGLLLLLREEALLLRLLRSLNLGLLVLLLQRFRLLLQLFRWLVNLGSLLLLLYWLLSRLVYLRGRLLWHSGLGHQWLVARLLGGWSSGRGSRWDLLVEGLPLLLDRHLSLFGRLLLLLIHERVEVFPLEVVVLLLEIRGLLAVLLHLRLLSNWLLHFLDLGLLDLGLLLNRFVLLGIWLVVLGLLGPLSRLDINSLVEVMETVMLHWLERLILDGDTPLVRILTPVLPEND